MPFTTTFKQYSKKNSVNSCRFDNDDVNCRKRLERLRLMENNSSLEGAVLISDLVYHQLE